MKGIYLSVAFIWCIIRAFKVKIDLYVHGSIYLNHEFMGSIF